MQLSRRHLLRPLLAAAGAGLLATPVRAGVTDQNASYSFNYFADSDDVHVYTNYLDYLIDLERGARLDLQWTHETVIIPAIKAPAGSQEAVDAITTASRPINNGSDAYSDFSKGRNQVEGDITYRAVRGGYYVSSETDYFAQLVRLDYNRELRNQTLTLTAGGSYGWDHINPAPDADTQSIADHKNTLHGHVAASQVLGPTTVLQLGAELNLVEGLQHNPYRNVYVAGSNVPEAVPDHRQRQDVYLKLNQYLKNRSSIKLAYTFYHDDWGINSQTIGVRLAQYVSDAVVVNYRYRFYTQDAAWFYRDEYLQPGGVEGMRTADYRLGEFRAHLFGAHLDWELGGLGGRLDFLRGIRLGLDYERYFNSNNFSANLFESGLSLAF